MTLLFGIFVTPRAEAYRELRAQVAAAERGGWIWSAPRTIEGPVDHWVEMLARWTTELRAGAFIFWPSDSATTEIEGFAAEVMRAVRARVSETAQPG